ncbi:MAG: hypothetical protein Q9227_008357 [Pyrenula ochraceoflavens]
MPLQVQPALEEDVARLQEIEATAFETCEAMRIMWPFVYGNERTKEAEEDHKAYLLSHITEDQLMEVMKVVDTGNSNEIIAFASFHICLEGLPNPELRDTRNPTEFGLGSNLEACLGFYSLSFQRQIKHIKNKPCAMLEMLCTDPKHSRRGAASLLLEWSCKRAKEEQLPLYLETFETGHKLYERYGFHDVDSHIWDMRPFGGSGTCWHGLMLKEN